MGTKKQREDHNMIFRPTLWAEHQHFFDEHPQTFPQHFRGIGDPIQLAKAAIAAVKATSTPLPQHVPSNPTTPFPVKESYSCCGSRDTVAGTTQAIHRQRDIHPGHL
jgi:hypothetical protein